MDLSLTSSGLCKITKDGIIIESIKTNPNKFSCDLERYNHIVEKVIAFIPEDVDLIVVEDFFVPQNKMQINAAMKLIGLGHLVRMQMFLKGLPFFVPSPSQLKKFVSGKGTCPKDMICKEVWKKWNIDTTDDDQADATVGAHLARVLANELRKVDQELPAYQKEVVKKVLEERPFYNKEKFN
jgi:Holliday junction resolvasome RuvABC endonuclease subunit